MTGCLFCRAFVHVCTIRDAYLWSRIWVVKQKRSTLWMTMKCFFLQQWGSVVILLNKCFVLSVPGALTLACAVLATARASIDPETRGCMDRGKTWPFLQKRSCRPDNGAYMRRNLWLLWRQGVQMCDHRPSDNAEACFLPSLPPLVCLDSVYSSILPSTASKSFVPEARKNKIDSRH